MEKNEVTELRDFLIEHNYPQSIIDLIEDLPKNDLLSLIKW